MKKIIAAALTLLVFTVAARAVDMALVYENDAAVTAGHSWPAPIVDGGAVVPSSGALTALNTILYGDADGLYRGQIARLDNDLNLAVIRRGERVGDDALQTAHAKNWQACATFLNISTPTAAVPGVAVAAVAPVVEDQPFLIKIDDYAPGEKPVVLKERFNKAKFNLSIVNTSTSPVWSIQVDLTAEPALSFWKEGRHGGLNDVPTKTFEYNHQAVFNPMRNGTGFSVPVEVYFIKEHDYIWHFTISSKGRSYERKVLVRFE